MNQRCVALLMLIAVAAAGVASMSFQFGQVWLEAVSRQFSVQLAEPSNYIPSTRSGSPQGNGTGASAATSKDGRHHSEQNRTEQPASVSPERAPPPFHPPTPTNRKAACESSGGLAKQLADMEKLFNYSFTTPSSVLGNLSLAVLDDEGSAQRSACGLRRVLHRWFVHRESLTLSIVGGSSSQRPCSKIPGSRYRYGDMLQNGLSGIVGGCKGKVQVDNAAHGGTESFWTALVLDELVSVSRTQVLVVEYATNDALGGSTGAASRSVENMRAGMQGFLTSVARLFGNAGRVPTIVLVYLWDAGGLFPRSSTWEAQAEVVSLWRTEGMEILPVLVGPSIVPPDHRSVLQDDHHPGCKGHWLIADMITYSLLRALISTLDKGGGDGDAMVCSEQSVRKARAASMAARQHSWVPLPNEAALWGAIMGANRVGSFMMWEPKQGVSRLAVRMPRPVRTERMWGAKLAMGRSDIKNVFVMPVCSKGNATSLCMMQAGTARILTNTLFTKDLEALALGFGGGIHHTQKYAGDVRVYINGLKANNQYNSTSVMIKRYIQFFVVLGSDGGVPGAVRQVLQMCKVGQVYGQWGRGDPQLNWIIGFLNHTSTDE